MDIDFKKIEEKWQKRWEEASLFKTKKNEQKQKYYVLEMFPYPSGDGLHMGHALNYTIGDVLARYKRMNGFNVLYPTGYDALGLPAENAAVKAGTHPYDYTKRSIANFIRQQKSIGLSYDWSRLINTAEPEYYKWDQWIFLKMLEKDLVYQKESAVNWCSECESVLANEQVHNGRCWRHEDTPVETRSFKQWFLKITDYANELYEDIDKLDGWPEKTKAMQKNWIGKSHGTEIDFEVNEKRWPIFTTRPDTIFGVTFMVISAQHEKLMDITTEEQRDSVKAFLKRIKTVSQKSIKELDNLDKEGVFTGAYATNPANGEMVPIYAGNFVVADYGSGMVMAVPAHDKRDFEFAKKYDIPVREVISGGDVKEEAYTKDGELINSGEFNGIFNKKAIEDISDDLLKKGKARKVVNFRLRDWGISRQRYWGTPIPIIECEKCGSVPVPEKDLPVILPRDVDFGRGNPLESAKEWLEVSCPVCSGKARRVSDTMDTFVNSSWYFLRYTDNENDESIFESEKANYWCPIDQYIGGAEHACMHLIYFRFYTKFLADLGLINFREPAKRLFHQGMLHGEGGMKMSKSKGNVINPDEASEKYGIDTARYFLLSLAEPDKARNWSDAGIKGSLRFVKKIFEAFENIRIGKSSDNFEMLLNKTIKEVSQYYDEFRYRMATIKLKELFEKLSSEEYTSKENLKKSLKILHPICPHITEELWEKIGGDGFISVASWPKANETKIKEKSSSVDLNDKIISSIDELSRKLKEKGQALSRVTIYVMPFETLAIDKDRISSDINEELDVFVYAVNDKEKYDPEKRAKKAKPGSPSFYFE